MDNDTKQVKVVPKENQIFLHHSVYDIDYVVEFNPRAETNEIELIFDFPDKNNLSSEQIDEIISESKIELLKAFNVGDAAVTNDSNIEQL